MLYETSTQPLIFLILLLTGFATGFLYDLRLSIVFLSKNNKIVKIILDFLTSLGTCFILFLLVLKFDFGELRLFHFLVFYISLGLQRITLGKMIAKLSLWCYNLTRKFCEKNQIRTKKCKKEKTNLSKQQSS